MFSSSVNPTDTFRWIGTDCNSIELAFPLIIVSKMYFAFTWKGSIMNSNYSAKTTCSTISNASWNEFSFWSWPNFSSCFRIMMCTIGNCNLEYFIYCHLCWCEITWILKCRKQTMLIIFRTRFYLALAMEMFNLTILNKT